MGGIMTDKFITRRQLLQGSFGAAAMTALPFSVWAEDAAVTDIAQLTDLYYAYVDVATGCLALSLPWLHGYTCDGLCQYFDRYGADGKYGSFWHTLCGYWSLILYIV